MKPEVPPPDYRPIVLHDVGLTNTTSSIPFTITVPSLHRDRSTNCQRNPISLTVFLQQV